MCFFFAIAFNLFAHKISIDHRLFCNHSEHTQQKKTKENTCNFTLISNETDKYSLIANVYSIHRFVYSTTIHVAKIVLFIDEAAMMKPSLSIFLCRTLNFSIQPAIFSRIIVDDCAFVPHTQYYWRHSKHSIFLIRNLSSPHTCRASLATHIIPVGSHLHAIFAMIHAQALLNFAWNSAVFFSFANGRARLEKNVNRHNELARNQQEHMPCRQWNHFEGCAINHHLWRRLARCTCNWAWHRHVSLPMCTWCANAHSHCRLNVV